MQPHNQQRALFIGGFAFNLAPVMMLTQIFPNYQFIDINHFSDRQSYPLILESITWQIRQYQPQFIIAYSMGGLFALDALKLLDNNSSKLIIINGSPYFMAQKNWNGLIVDDFNQLKAKLGNLEVTVFMSYLTRLFAYPKEDYQKLISSSWWSNTSKSQLSNLLEILYTADLREVLPYYSHQITWINGKLDNLIKLNNLPSRQILLPDSSHLILNQEEILKIALQLKMEQSYE